MFEIALGKWRQFVVYTALALLLPVSAQCATIHLLMVGDTRNEAIADGVQADLTITRAFFEIAAEKVQTELRVKELSGRALTVDALYQALNNLNPGADDTVIFLFAGSGIRTADKQSPWPDLSIGPQTVDFADVIAALRAKGARLTLAFSHAGNEFAQTNQTPKTKDDTQWIADSLRRLLLQSRGTVFATASRPGENAIETPIGSLFTWGILIGLADEVSSMNADWDDVLSKAALATLAMSGNLQEPYGEVNVKVGGGSGWNAVTF